MLLEQCGFQILSWSIFDLEYSSRLLLVQDHKVIMVQDYDVPPQRIWNSHIILYSSRLYQWSFGLKLGFSLNCTGIQNCRWRHVHHHLSGSTCRKKLKPIAVLLNLLGLGYTIFTMGFNVTNGIQCDQTRNFVHGEAFEAQYKIDRF